jgi:molecular chaperone DnaK (HSP70)
MDILPSVKDKANIKWLLENEETFLKYMSETHSPIDLAHTFLYFKTFDDNYVSNMIKKIEARDKNLIKEQEKRIEDIKAKPAAPAPKKNRIDKKIEKMEKAAEQIQKEKFGDDDLLDD